MVGGGAEYKPTSQEPIPHTPAPPRLEHGVRAQKRSGAALRLGGRAGAAPKGLPFFPRRRQAEDGQQQRDQAVEGAAQREQRRQLRLAKLPIRRRGVGVQSQGADDRGLAREDGVRGQKRRGGVGLAGSIGKFEGQHIWRVTNGTGRLHPPLRGGGGSLHNAAVTCRSRSSEEDERAGRIRAVPQLRGELLDCGAEGWGTAEGSAREGENGRKPSPQNVAVDLPKRPGRSVISAPFAFCLGVLVPAVT